MKLNVLKLSHLARPRTHEGAAAVAVTPEQALRRCVMACMLWESEFYEDGLAISGRIRELVPKVAAEKVAAMAALVLADGIAAIELALNDADRPWNQPYEGRVPAPQPLQIVRWIPSLHEDLFFGSPRQGLAYQEERRYAAGTGIPCRTQVRVRAVPAWRLFRAQAPFSRCVLWY